MAVDLKANFSGFSSSILRSYRKYYIEAGGYQGIHIVFKILGSWDFGLTSLDAVKLKHRSTVNEIKVSHGFLFNKHYALESMFH